MDHRRRLPAGSATADVNKHHPTMAGISSANGQLRHAATGGLHPPSSRASLLAYDPHLVHLSPIDRRESSASAGSSIGSYDSGSTLTSDLDNSAIMTRLRKSFEQKEEFLRRGLPQSKPAVATDPLSPTEKRSTAAQQSPGQWSDGSTVSDKCKFFHFFKSISGTS